MLQAKNENQVNLLSECCLICGCELNLALSLPDLPLTGIYNRQGFDGSTINYDQELLVCSCCGHGQLKYSINPELLYGNTYGFRTSESSTASKGSDFFALYLESLFPNEHFARVMEFGCNDAYLLERLSAKGERLLGIDPIWRGRESEYNHKNVNIAGAMLQDVDFEKLLGGEPDLVISQHTMEHIEDPKSLIEHLFQRTNENTIFLFEFPCFDPLLENFRFDQVFHQHLQYYSLRSFLTLLQQVGGELIDYTFNHTYWGALLIAFKKTSKISTLSKNHACIEIYQETSHYDIQQRYSLFQSQMKTTKSILDSIQSDSLYGYGAALMLPILGYHLGTDFSNFQCILDDDPKKDGLGYPNLKVKIRNPVDVDFSTINICLTAMDNRRPILRNLVSKQPRRIINPLNII